ncbi:tetratricopeptide repeat protein [Lachnospiraceae bacterium ZAX-1]
MLNKKAIKYRTIIAVAIAITVATGCAGQSEESLKNEQAYRQLGINRMEEGDYKGAVDAFQRGLDESFATIRELELDICYYKALAQYKSGDVKGAIDTYTALVDYDKNNADALYLRGCMYLTEGKTGAENTAVEKSSIDKAQEDFKCALKIDDGNCELYLNIATKLKSVGRIEECDEILNDALGILKDTAEDARNKGKIYLELGDYENARKQFDRAINKKDSEAILYLAQVYDAEGNAEQAKSLYETYIKQHADDTETLNSLGCLQMGAENYTQALELFQTALAVENAKNEQELRRNEIAAYEYLLDFATAKQKIESYVKDYPEDEEAQRESVFLQTRK